jgi:hypothetical protein
VLAGSPCSTTSALVLYAKRPFGGPQQVLSYLANYTHRVALSNRRIVAVDAQHQSVTFTYRDYRHGSLHHRIWYDFCHNLNLKNR